MSITSLYIHIPFCVSRCSYCGFFSTTKLSFRSDYVKALRREMDLRGGIPADGWYTVYVGGGTPSTLNPRDLKDIFTIAHCNETQEVTMECNPCDVTEALSDHISSLPINRISMGVQTFDLKMLNILNRRHSPNDVKEAIERLRRAGIHNISVDLMYALPNQTLSQCIDDTNKIIDLGVEHVSTYCLSYEKDTVLWHKVKCGEITPTDDDLCAEMYYSIVDMLSKAGYEHYELSNFALPNRHSLHNSACWKGFPYVGIGTGAHSYDGQIRRWNSADIDAYINGTKYGNIPFEREILTPYDQYNETVMLGLRTIKGINLQELAFKHGKRLYDYCLDFAKHYIDDGMLEIRHYENNYLRLTHKALFVCDMITRDLMIGIDPVS